MAIGFGGRHDAMSMSHKAHGAIAAHSTADYRLRIFAAICEPTQNSGQGNACLASTYGNAACPTSCSEPHDQQCQILKDFGLSCKLTHSHGDVTKQFAKPHRSMSARS